jgi:hypothetical protein
MVLIAALKISQIEHRNNIILQLKQNLVHEYYNLFSLVKFVS